MYTIKYERRLKRNVSCTSRHNIYSRLVRGDVPIVIIKPLSAKIHA